MDLQTISSQMKIVIQKHQIVVTEMRNDPQNPVLQKRLHDLQLEILSLNERQKQIVEDLRKNLEPKQQNSCVNNHSIFPSVSLSPSPQVTSQEVRMPIGPRPNAPSLRQPVPLSANHLTPTATFTFKAPMGTVVLPNTANSLLQSEQQKIHPVLVVPSPSNRASDGQPGVFFNLVPPIRVPQYPPRTPMPITCQKNQIVNNFVPIAPLPSVPTSGLCSFTTTPELNSISSSENSPVNVFEKYQPPPIVEKINHKIDQKKKDFLSALGLVTRECLSDIRSKKLERKRRSTANPQFSNAALEEKWRNAAAAAQGSAASLKRPRGRPRMETKLVNCSTNGTCSGSDMRPSSPLDNGSAGYAVSSSSSPLSDSSMVLNGVHKQASGSEDGKNVEHMLSGLCIMCTQPGDLVQCDTCANQQHPGCMQPPLVTRPQVPWQCTECRTVSLSVVQSYDVLKAAKEDEKRKLLKKSLELRLKRSQLEGRLHQLRELSGKQKNRQSELQTSTKGMETLLDRMHSVIGSVRLCS